MFRLRGRELVCRFAVAKRASRCRLGREDEPSVCLGKSLNYLVKSAGAQSLAAHGVVDSLHTGQNTNKAA